jgi:hypothetical protein
MKNKIIAIVFLFFLVAPFVSAFNASTDSYTVGSYHQGLSGSESNTTNYIFRNTMTYQQGGNANATTTNYQFNVGWFGNSSAIIVDLSTPTPTPISTPTSSGGGGCRYDLNYDWECSEWTVCTNEEQTRICNEFNNCHNNWSRPEVTRTCVPEELFDIRMDLEETLLSSASDLEAIVTFFSFGTIPTHVNLTYIILDKDESEVYRVTGDITVITQEVLRKTFEELELPDGEYTFVLHTLYGDDVFDEFEQDFEIRTKPPCELFGFNFGKFIFCWYWWVLIGLITLGLLTWTIISLVKYGKLKGWFKGLFRKLKNWLKGLFKKLKRRGGPAKYEYVYKRQFRKAPRIRNPRIKYKKSKIKTLKKVKKLKGG